MTEPGDTEPEETVKLPWYFRLRLRGDTTSANYRDFMAGGLGRLLANLLTGQPVARRDLRLYGLEVDVEDDAERRIAEQGNRSHFADTFAASVARTKDE